MNYEFPLECYIDERYSKGETTCLRTRKNMRHRGRFWKIAKIFSCYLFMKIFMLMLVCVGSTL